MTYIENVFICLTAPMLVGAICAGAKHRRPFVFMIVGFGVCLLSAYVNTFFTTLYQADVVTATVEITPTVEENMKLLPLLFYLLIFEPKRQHARDAIIIIGASFATFENTLYLIEHGASQFSTLFIRGFSTGAMHIICGAIVGYGLIYVWDRPWFKVAGTFGLLCAAITYHAIFNLLISAEGLPHTICLLSPLLTLVTAFVAIKTAKMKRPV